MVNRFSHFAVRLTVHRTGVIIHVICIYIYIYDCAKYCVYIVCMYIYMYCIDLITFMLTLNFDLLC